MAVVATISRGVAAGGSGHTVSQNASMEFCAAALSGTYATGGFTFNPFAVSGGPGTSPLSGSKVIAMQWMSPLGYTYASSTTGQVTTTKIFTAPNTELANGTAVPDAVVPVIITKSRG